MSQPHVVFIGPPGAGKTRLGKRVAKLLRTDFVDTDRRIVAGHGPIADIFSQRGEEFFRRIERSEVSQALTEKAVVSLGGGAVLDPATQADLATQCVVLVTVSPEAVASRIAKSNRPLAGDMDAWTRLVEGRREIYERLATRTWDTSNLPIDDIAAEIAAWLKTARTTGETSL
jgi:shikimate kinase